MIKLNLPSYQPRYQEFRDTQKIFDPVRKKYVLLTPEEWVRQHVLNYLLIYKKVPGSLIAVEKKLMINQILKRTDIVVYNNLTMPVMLVECKSPNVKINQDIFDQVVRYNLSLKVKYVMVTNGLEHYCCRMDYENQSWAYLTEIPDYSAW
ncbi:MAG: type I restriction enzyme HsdR N-terminal domain-containing protein [Bacteroidetes bacterium]|nr:type I restriction enzyme HsdR N-terminal domain-containing protein [Bacteroidota bacterium]